MARADFNRRGLQGVPAFLIGEDVVVGLDTKKIEALIDYRVETCPNCKSRLRVPKDKGKLKINCPKCEESFILET